MPKSTDALSRNVEVYDTTLGWRITNYKLPDMYYPYTMGETAENVAEQYNISRADQDAWAVTSQQRCGAAMTDGRFKDELCPVPVTDRKGNVTVYDTDEHPRPDTTLDKLAKLKPAFREGGSVTAGNASGIND